MRAISLLTAAIIPSGLLAWQGTGSADGTSQAALQKAKAAGDLSLAGSQTAISLQHGAGFADQLSAIVRPTPSTQVIAAAGITQQARKTVNLLPHSPLLGLPTVAETAPAPGGSVPTRSGALPQAYSPQSLSARPLSWEIDTSQVKAVVNQTIGDRSPVLAMAEPSIELEGSGFVSQATFPRTVSPRDLSHAVAETAEMALQPAAVGMGLAEHRRANALTQVEAQPVVRFSSRALIPRSTVLGTRTLPSNAQGGVADIETEGERALAAVLANRAGASKPTFTQGLFNPSQQTARAELVSIPSNRSASEQNWRSKPLAQSGEEALQVLQVRPLPAAMTAPSREIAQLPNASQVTDSTASGAQGSANAQLPSFPTNSPSNPSSNSLPGTRPNDVPAAAPMPVFAEPQLPANTGPIPSGAFNSGAVSTSVDEDYILGPGDIIEVIVFNVPEYSGQHRISTNGVINLPLIGRVPVKDLTLNQAADVIAASYVYQLQSPIVTINVLQQRPMQIAIAGEIAQPGLYTLAAQGTAYPRIFEVLQQAGGLTQAADLKQVEVRRQGANGVLSTLKVNLLALLQEGDISQNIYLQDGDAIVIPSAAAIDRNALSQLSASNLRASSNQPINVAIVGAVTQPGPYQLGGEGSQITVVQALQQAGGIIPSADLRNIQLRRRTRQGDEQTFAINLWDALQSGDLTQDVALQQGDTLLVPTAADIPIAEVTALASSSLSTGTIQVNVVGEVESPGKLDIRANTSLNQALLAAGGLNRRARNEVTLIRFNPNGTVDRKPIEINLSEDINPETNPILRPNDVIIAGRSGRAAFDDSISGFSRTFNLVWPFLFLF